MPGCEEDAMSSGLLLDEYTTPPLALVIGGLMSSAREADFAVREIRLAGLDLEPRMLAGLEHCRVLLGRLDAGFHSDALATWCDPARRERLRHMLDFAHSHRLQVRAAGVATWAPDFSVYRGLSAPFDGQHAALLLGAHYFERPYAVSGIALTTLLARPAAVRLAQQRYQQL